MSHILRTAASALVLYGLAMAATAAAAKEKPALRQGSRYVAMGSSFASGSGIAPYDPAAPTRCQRSMENYARQLARKRKLSLVDVSCGGATTEHILGPWNELPPQVDALTPDTALVTITIGGNDVGYVGGLISGSCSDSDAASSITQPICQMIAAARRGGPAMPISSDGAWPKLETALTAIIGEVRRRSPRARIVFVDYLAVLPEGVLCAETPLPSQAAEIGRDTAARLARVTAEVARRNGAEVLQASELSRREHSACANTPWVSGFIPPGGSSSFVPYHPNRAGMTAVAKALDRQLRH